MDFMTYAVFGVVIGAGLGFVIGQRKGRPIDGAVLGGILGPIGWLPVGFGETAGPKCPACKGGVPAGASKCMHCGSDLPESF